MRGRVHAKVAVETFEVRGARFAETERAETARELVDELRDQNFSAQRQVCDTRGNDDRAAVEVVGVPQCLAGVHTNANTDGNSLVTGCEPLLDREAAPERERRGGERDH